MENFEFILEDRIAKIQAINDQYNLLDNAYIAFSGGKDSTVLHYLIDMALPNNKIPRIYANTGIEYKAVVTFVKTIATSDERFIVVNQKNNIKKTLEQYGYPFKSKEHSLRIEQFNKGSSAPFLKKYITGYKKNGKETLFKCPKVLLYQFEERGKYNYSNKCCYKLKKQLLDDFTKKINKTTLITGMRSAEGGNRRALGCTIFKNNKLQHFHPLIVINDNWEDEFIKRFNIKLCELYYPPYNFKRTGCKGSPYSLTLQHDLDIMEDLLPNEKKQCEILWKPVYDEYRRIGYRLRKKGTYRQMKFEFEDISPLSED